MPCGHAFVSNKNDTGAAGGGVCACTQKCPLLSKVFTAYFAKLAVDCAPMETTRHWTYFNAAALVVEWSSHSCVAGSIGGADLSDLYWE